MKTLTLYNSFAPMFRRPNYLSDGFELLDRVLGMDGLERPLGARNPAVDVRETAGAYILEVELPGFSEKDVKIELKEGVLSLSTAVPAEEGKERGTWLRRERREFAFARSFSLPDDADSEAIQARLRDGLLVIEIAKRPETAPRTIPVKVA